MTEGQRRKPCDAKCPCLCHDGWCGDHPNEDCLDFIFRTGGREVLDD